MYSFFKIIFLHPNILILNMLLTSFKHIFCGVSILNSDNMIPIQSSWTDNPIRLAGEWSCASSAGHHPRCILLQSYICLRRQLMSSSCTSLDFTLNWEMLTLPSTFFSRLTWLNKSCRGKTVWMESLSALFSWEIPLQKSSFLESCQHFQHCSLSQKRLK